MIREGLDADAFVLEAQIDVRQLLAALIEVLLDIVLLKIDEGRHLVPAFGQQVELVEQLGAVEHLAELPGDALGDGPLADAEPVEDLQRALGVAQAARALAERGLAVDDDTGHAARAEIGRQRQPDRAAADDHDRMPHRPAASWSGERR